MHFEGSDTVMHTVGFCLCKNKYTSYAYNCMQFCVPGKCYIRMCIDTYLHLSVSQKNGHRAGGEMNTLYSTLYYFPG